jgi:hypothetical protein
MSDILEIDKSSRWYKGKFKPNHPEKYQGDLDNIVFRSSWELEAFRFCDNNPNILKWSSEEIKIPYLLPTPDGNVKKLNYFPDLYMELVDRAGQHHRQIIEIKPKRQTKPSRSRNQRVKLQENLQYHKNMCKWQAAEEWCKHRGIRFRVLHEGDQFK